MSNFKKYISYFRFFIPLLTALLLLGIFSWFPSAADFYSSVLFPIFSWPIAQITSSFNFSVAEAFMFPVLVILLIVVIRFIVCLFRSENKKRMLAGWFQKTARFLTAVFIIYLLLHGYHYYRTPMAESFGIPVEQKDAQDILRVSILLAKEASTERALLNSDENGNMLLTETLFETFSHADAGFQEVSSAIHTLPAVQARAKPVRLSHYWSYTGVGGMYFPFTVEANINVDMPDWVIPFTVCHELSHTIGYAKEEEASFLSFLACINNPSADYRYSGYLSAFLECAAVLQRYDRGMWEEAWSYVSDDVRADISQNTKYWKQFEGQVQTVSSAVNDTFLKVNSQAKGVLSYNMVTELIVAFYS